MERLSGKEFTYQGINVHKMKAILTLFLFIVLTAFQNANIKPPLEIPEFKIHILKNYRFPRQYRSECKFFYASIIAQTNKANKIIGLQFKNEISDGMKGSFNFINGYQFPEKYKINGKPVLFFLNIDLEEICPGVSDSSHVTNVVLKESLNNIKEQLQKEPNTVILYEVVPVKVYQISQ